MWPSIRCLFQASRQVCGHENPLVSSHRLFFITALTNTSSGVAQNGHHSTLPTGTAAKTKHQRCQEGYSCVISEGRRWKKHSCWSVQKCRYVLYMLILTFAAANLSLAFARLGHRSGILDVDIFGPSIPTLFKLHEEPRLSQSRSINPNVGLISRLTCAR